MTIAEISNNTNNSSYTFIVNLRPQTISTETCSSSPSSSWKKFTTESYCESCNSYGPTLTESNWPTQGAPLFELFNRINNGLAERRFGDAIVDLDYIQEKLLPLANDILYCAIVALKEFCYEGMDRYDLAIENLNEILCKLEKHAELFEEIQMTDSVNQCKETLFLRKAALLLHLGQNELALEILRSYQPSDKRELLMMYRLIEKKLNVELLKPTALIELTDEEDWFHLAFNGKVEEAINSLDSDHPTYYKHTKALIYALNGSFDYVDDILVNDTTDLFDGYGEDPLDLIFAWIKK